METEQRPEVVAQKPKITSGSSLGIPIAIVLAAALIAGAIVFSGMQKSGSAQKIGAGEEQVTAEVEIAPVTDKDHIKGNPNAPIMIVEYSDFDCPFCKNFHETMNKIMADYGADGKVAWVFRQFPLEQLHPNAPATAAASECVASLGGNDAFWKFADMIYQDRTTNEPTNITKLPEYAEKAGVNKAKYNECVSAGTFTQKIADDVAAAVKTGARGTPYSILMVGDQQGIINGAQPYATVKKMVDTMVQQLGG
jgi:protein-disulfide isomerase